MNTGIYIRLKRGSDEYSDVDLSECTDSELEEHYETMNIFTLVKWAVRITRLYIELKAEKWG